MIRIDRDEHIIQYQGDSAQLMSETGGILVTIFKEVRRLEGDRMAIGMTVRMIQQVIDILKISPTEILEAIRDVEVVNDVTESK